jgi:hypothetical protein
MREKVEQTTEDRGQMAVATTLSQKFLWMLHGPGGGFLEKSPLAAGGFFISQQTIAFYADFG